MQIIRMSNGVDEQDRLNRLKTLCRDLGLKLTHQRMEIFLALAAATDHPSAETLHRRLKERIPTISLDTVYRTLFTFQHYQLVQKVETVESQARFEVRWKPHHHLICKRCNEIMDFEWPAIDSEPLPKEMASWGRVESKNIVAYGTCQKCLEQRTSGKKGG